MKMVPVGLFKDLLVVAVKNLVIVMRRMVVVMGKLEVCEVPSTIMQPFGVKIFDEALLFVFLSLVYGFIPSWHELIFGPAWPCLL